MCGKIPEVGKSLEYTGLSGVFRVLNNLNTT